MDWQKDLGQNMGVGGVTDYATLPTNIFRSLHRAVKWANPDVPEEDSWRSPQLVKCVWRRMTCFAEYGTCEDYFVVALISGRTQWVAVDSDEGKELGKRLSESGWCVTDKSSLVYAREEE